jgi:hypothetical protein
MHPEPPWHSERHHRAAKLGQHTVTSRVGDTAIMGRNQSIQDFPARSEGIEGSDLIASHEAAVALDVSCKDSSQATLHFHWVRQG